MRAEIIVLTLFACLIAAGCGDMQISAGGHNIDAGKWISATEDAYKAWHVSPETERNLGHEAAANLAARYGFYDDADLLRYVNLVGLTLARKTDRKDVKYRFGVLNTKDINAFSTPGGYVFITKGMLKILEDESELAGVLAHEIEHVDRNHAVNAMRTSNMASAIAKSIEKDKFNLMTSFIISQMERGFDSDKEYDADKFGVMLAAKAGYDPSGLPRALKQYKDNAKDPHAASFTARHPPFDKRISKLADLQDLPESGAVLKKRFLNNSSF